MIRRRRNKLLWSPTVASSSGWSESTLAEQSWEMERGRATRWAVVGGVLGIVFGLVLFAPAAWLARAVTAASDERVVLADARGTIWSGSAVPVLAGGAGSRDASYLPGRLEWSMWPWFTGLELALKQSCCVDGTLRARIVPGLGRVRATVLPTGGNGATVGRWPSAWLAGLGTPWNTLQLGGNFRLASPGFTVERVEGRWRLDGKLDLELENVSSRLTTLDVLGSYRVSVSGGDGPALLSLSTQDGPLQLTGSGTWGPAGIKFRGEARSAAVDEAALANLLNIIGRRDGARSIISIG